MCNIFCSTDHSQSVHRSTPRLHCPGMGNLGYGQGIPIVLVLVISTDLRLLSRRPLPLPGTREDPESPSQLLYFPEYASFPPPATLVHSFSSVPIRERKSDTNHVFLNTSEKLVASVSHLYSFLFTYEYSQISPPFPIYSLSKICRFYSKDPIKGLESAQASVGLHAVEIAVGISRGCLSCWKMASPLSR